MNEKPYYIELLGGLRILRDGRVLTEFPAQQVGLLLAFLALNSHRPIPREEVIESLWPDIEAEAGRARLRHYTYTLRRELKAASASNDELILAPRDNIRLNQDIVSSDVAAFEATLRGGSATPDARERIRLLEAAGALYKGELLPGFYDDTIVAQRDRLAEIRRNALMALAAAYKQADRPTEALDTAKRALEMDPLHEDANSEVIRLLATTGQTAAAMRQYQKLSQALSDEFGVAPSAEIQALVASLRENGNGASVKAPSTAPKAIDAPTVTLTIEGVGGRDPVAKAPRTAPPAASDRVRPTLRVRDAGIVALSALIFWFGWTLSARHHVEGTSAPTRSLMGDGGVDDRDLQMSHPKYDTEKWVSHLSERPGDGDSEPTGMALGRDGATFVTGFIQTAKQDVDYVTAKFDRYGREVWQSRFNGPKNDCDRARSIAVDSADCAYVTGDSYNGDKDKGGSDYDVVTIKYDPNGKELWRRTFDGPTHGADMANKLLLDKERNVYVGVEMTAGPPQGTPRHAFALLKYDTNGGLIWKRTYDNSGKGATLCTLAGDADGKTYLCGGVITPDGHNQILTVKYDANGKIAWEERYSGLHGQAFATAIALDGVGHLDIAGTVPVNDAIHGAGTYGVTLQYSVDSELIWARIFPDGSIGEICPKAIVTSQDGEVAVVGAGSDGCRFMMVVAYAPDSRMLWSRRITGKLTAMPGSEARGAYAVGRDVFVTGRLPVKLGAKSSMDLTTLEFGWDGGLNYYGMNNGWGSGENEGLLTEFGDYGPVVVGISCGKRHGSIVVMHV